MNCRNDVGDSAVEAFSSLFGQHQNARAAEEDMVPCFDSGREVVDEPHNRLGQRGQELSVVFSP